jgi:hypothetical protein
MFSLSQLIGARTPNCLHFIKSYKKIVSADKSERFAISPFQHRDNDGYNDNVRHLHDAI